MIDENRVSEIAVIGSASLSNEEAYAIRKFFGDSIKISNIDFQSSLRQPLEPELVDMIGLDGTMKDLENDTLFLMVGCDPAVEHPIMSLRMRKAISRRKSKAVFLGPFDKRFGYFPVENIRIPMAAEARAVNYIVSILNGADYGHEADKSFDAERLTRLAEAIRNSEKVHILAGDSFFAHPDRGALLSSLVRLRKAAGCRLSLIPSEGNFIGVSRFGLYGGLEHSFRSILEKINSGEIKTMFIFGSNPVEEFPDRKYVHDTLKKLEFLVVVNPFMTPTASMASIAYPQALTGEYGGSYVNVEGRVQRFEPMDDHFRLGYRPAWALISELSSYMDVRANWRHESQVRSQMAAELKGMEALANIPEKGAVLFGAVEYYPGEINPQPAAGPPSDRPYRLQCVDSSHHSGWLTEYSGNLMRIAGIQRAVIHPDDAYSLEISSGAYVRIGTEDTAINLPVEISDKVNRGEILVENSFGANPVNRLMNKDKPITFVSVRKN